MGLRFRKSVKLGGIRFNFTHNGLTSASVGKKGLTTNISKKGIRSTVGLKGTGISYSHLHKFDNQPNQPNKVIHNYPSSSSSFFKTIKFLLKLFFLVTILAFGIGYYLNETKNNDSQSRTERNNKIDGSNLSHEENQEVKHIKQHSIENSQDMSDTISMKTAIRDKSE